MSDYANKLLSIVEKKQKLVEEESRLIEKRKDEIGVLAQKFELLTTSDVVFAGLFAELQSALKSNSDKITHWEKEGAHHFTPKRIHSKATQESSK